MNVATNTRGSGQKPFLHHLLETHPHSALQTFAYPKPLITHTPPYHNQIIFKDFKEADFNIFFILCTIAKGQKARTIKIDFEQMRMFIANDRNKKRFYKHIVSFTKKLNSLKAQKSQIDNDGYEVFSAFTFFEHIIADEKSHTLTIKMTESSLKLINDLTSHFTNFELRELCTLNNKYAKNLYRLLKLHQTIGRYTLSFTQFRELMDIPHTYTTNDIDKRVLKPSLIKLTESSPHTGKPYFANLVCEKIKEKPNGQKSRGRGGRIEFIEFLFTPLVSGNFKVRDITNSVYTPPPPGTQNLK